MKVYKFGGSSEKDEAISFAVCIEDNFNNFGILIQDLNGKYEVLYN